MWGSTISSNSQSSAGASSQVSTSRRRLLSCGSSSGMHRCLAAAGEADCALRIESERHALTHLEIGEATGLRQRHAEFEAAALLVEQHGGVRAVEQQALHLAAEHQMIAR